MRRIASTLAAAALAIAPAAALGQGSSDPMAGYAPPKITREAQGKKELQALFKKMEDAGRKGDLAAAAALVDFPVMMITDSAKTGDAMGEAWSREQWEAVMKPFYEKPMADMKVTHKPTIFFLSDNLASIDDQWTTTQGGKKMSGRNSLLAIRKGGEWKVKAMAEAGWGDMPMPDAQGGATGATK